VIAISTAPGTC